MNTPPATPPRAPSSSGLRAWFAHSLARRLTAGLAVAVLVSTLVLAVLTQALGRRMLVHEHEAAAARLARVFEASLQNAMLQRDLEGMADILTTLGQAPGVRQAQLLAPEGQVRFASRPDAVGQEQAPALAGMCLHSGCPPAPMRLSWQALPDQTGQTDQSSQSGRALQIAYPIHNQPRCLQCHGSVHEKPVNGVLLVDFEPLDQVSTRDHLTLALAGLAALLAFAGIMALTLRRQVTQPLARLSQAASRLAAGDWSARATPASDSPGDDTQGDELVRVGRRFDHMAASLAASMGQVQAQRRFLQTLIDAMPDPVLVIGPDYRIRLANRAYGALLGIDAAHAVGTCCHASSRGRSEPCPSTLMTCPVAELRQRPQPLRSLMSLQRADGSAVEVDIEAAPLTTDEGETLTVEVMRPLDRTVRFSQEQRLSTIGLLANGVAHEIHNPLASIRLALQASLRGLKNDDMSHDELAEYLHIVDREIDRCVLTTRRLLQMSAMPGQTLEPVSVQTALDDVLALLREESRTRGVTIAHSVQPPDACVRADPAELRQVFVNLIHNALHATPPGGHIAIEAAPAPATEAHTPALPGDYRITVRDSGCGIAAEEQALIFMPFFSRRADGQRGTGLGLAISKAIMERFGGDIRVRSAPGAGSTFTLGLHRATGDNAAPPAQPLPRHPTPPPEPTP